MKTTIVKASLLALAMGASAANAAGINYNYVEAGFGQLDEGEAVFANGAVDINKNWGIVGGVEVGSVDVAFGDADVFMLEGGVQFHETVKSNLSVHGGVKLLYVEWESEVDGCAGIPAWARAWSGCGMVSYSADDIGFVGNVGLRFQVQPNLQLEGDAKLIVIDEAVAEDGFGVQGAARFFFSPQLSVAGGLAIDTELDGLFVSLRYDM
jgi:hypothetical protein